MATPRRKPFEIEVYKGDRVLVTPLPTRIVARPAPSPLTPADRAELVRMANDPNEDMDAETRQLALAMAAEPEPDNVAAAGGVRRLVHDAVSKAFADCGRNDVPTNFVGT